MPIGVEESFLETDSKLNTKLSMREVNWLLSFLIICIRFSFKVLWETRKILIPYVVFLTQNDKGTNWFFFRWNIMVINFFQMHPLQKNTASSTQFCVYEPHRQIPQKWTQLRDGIRTFRSLVLNTFSFLKLKIFMSKLWEQFRSWLVWKRI